MIIVDTNVLSEFMRPAPAAAVTTWLGLQDGEQLWTTTITEAELHVGAAILPESKRKAELERNIDETLSRFGHRILAFDRDAARQLAAVFSQRRVRRLDMKLADGQIAAIARAYGATVATRDIQDFAHTGVVVVNPWTARP
jgi:predicted nucleic acid-binding protein